MPFTRPTLATVVLIIGSLSASGCSRHSGPTEPSSFTVSGRVQLVGFLTAADGQYIGATTVDDADGVPVDLLVGTSVVAHTTTVDGVYAFGGLAVGTYSARSRIFAAVQGSTALLPVTRSDVVARFPIRLESYGDLYPTPNPIDARGTINFEIPYLELVHMRVLNSGGVTVCTLPATSYIAGLHQAFWYGRDDTLGVVPAGNYWLVFDGESDQRAVLLIKPSGPHPS